MAPTLQRSSPAAAAMHSGERGLHDSDLVYAGLSGLTYSQAKHILCFVMTLVAGMPVKLALIHFWQLGYADHTGWLWA